MHIRERIDRPYTRAVEWLKASPFARKSLTKQQISDVRAIAALGVWGQNLEERGVTHEQIRWVAGPRGDGPSGGAAEREKRYLAMLAFLKSGARPSEFARIRRTMPRAQTSKRWRNVPHPKALEPVAAIPGTLRGCND